MAVSIAVAIVLFVCLLFAADRAVKAVKRGLRRKEANRRLVAAQAQAEAKVRQRNSTSRLGCPRAPATGKRTRLHASMSSRLDG